MRRLFTVQTSTSQALKQGLKYKYHSEFWSKNNTKIFLHWHNPLLGPIPKSFPYFRESINSSSFHHKSTSPCGSLSCLFPHSFFSCHFFLGGEVVIDMQDYNYDPPHHHHHHTPSETPPSFSPQGKMEMEQKFCLDRGLSWEKWYRHTYKPHLLTPFLFIYTNGAVNGALWGFSIAEWRCQTVCLCVCDCVLVISVSLLLCPGRYSTFTWYLIFFFFFFTF